MRYKLTNEQKGQVKALVNTGVGVKKLGSEYAKGMAKGFITSAKSMAYMFLCANIAKG